MWVLRPLERTPPVWAHTISKPPHRVCVPDLSPGGMPTGQVHAQLVLGLRRQRHCLFHLTPQPQPLRETQTLRAEENTYCSQVRTGNRPRAQSEFFRKEAPLPGVVFSGSSVFAAVSWQRPALPKESTGHGISCSCF